MRALLQLAVLILALSACASTNSPGGSSFDPSQLVTTEIDRVTDAFRQVIFRELRVLAVKLYRRNPDQWRKVGDTSMKAAVARLFDPALDWHFPELKGSYGSDAIKLAFRDDYHGDRVLALIGGLGGMIDTAFEHKTKFYMTDDLDPQPFYNCARNVEIAVWRMSNDRNAQGHLFLLSNQGTRPQNLSFERDFGKLIGHLDMLSNLIAGKTNRAIVKVIQSLATAAFLPVSVLR